MTQHQKCHKVRTSVHAQMLCIMRVFMFMSFDVVCLMLVLNALVVPLAVFVVFP